MKEIILWLIYLFVISFMLIFIYLNKKELVMWFRNWRQEGKYRKKCNDLEMELKHNRETYSRSILELSKQLTDKDIELEYRNKTIILRDKTIKTLKDRIKELEE